MAMDGLTKAMIFTFDLNNDGTLEDLHFVDKGSGYLVYDKNGDGTINNGTEMFGAVTGDGFGELAQYDHDGNGWIDEGDDIFEKLKVWKQEGLHSLSSKNIGAIYLKAVDTPFALTRGRITTADGHQVDFSIKLEMSRSFTETRSFNVSLGDARLIDPLVLNFEGTHTQLSDRVFTFDLNNDGTLEDLNFVDKGSGYLVYDKNGDGTINNGTEMFGAVTGDGFGELAEYDHDGNGWIDEAIARHGA